MQESQQTLLPSYLRIFSLEGKTVLFTGATGGIGRSLVSAFASAGADVISLQLPSDPPIVKGIVESFGRRCTLVSCDLLNLGTIPKAIEEARIQGKSSRHPHQLRGYLHSRAYGILPITSMEDIFKVNVTAGVMIASECVKRWFLQPFDKRGVKKIINFASIASFQGNVETLAYSASKAAVVNMTKAMSNEWAPHGILVNSVCPGYTKSAITKHLYEDDAYNKRILPGIPCRRWADGDDLAGTLIYLVSSASNYVTGTCAIMDGGALGLPGLGAHL
ncbi:2-deoxy-D-gluconate 3-dehydrogenase [Mytilinidion resinicola]|uniref:2-deoxy-D-gluconate 3-dehydrogenase n=1 Tax=Mytilinidion resinicola TaxID=574789 RepID=A0A6A6XZ72_9PEZI|nr:2-deoxy-D-gluconate 3-dehydrogenase [Mytilinidion resinicola]KAF2801812.1 2-deoxy-D-gluconate 3-dehydrogenase [Mytilinidion resinicola]